MLRWLGLIGSNSFSCMILQGGVDAGLCAQHVRLISDVGLFIFPSPRCRRTCIHIGATSRTRRRRSCLSSARRLRECGKPRNLVLLGTSLTCSCNWDSCTLPESKRFHSKWVRLAPSRQLSLRYLPNSKMRRSIILSKRSWRWQSICNDCIRECFRHILLGFWDSRGLEVMTENVQYYAL